MVGSSPTASTLGTGRPGLESQGRPTSKVSFTKPLSPGRMRVVITGGAGFIGSNLVHYWMLTHPDDQVVVVDALTYAGRRESLSDLDGDPRFSFYHANIGDREALDPALRGADLVVNLAAESHNDRAILDPLPFVTTNVLGTAILLEECRRRDIGGFHHVSTDEVFGSLSLKEPVRFVESSPYRPRGPYSASKAGSDHLVRAWGETYGMRVTLTNSGNNFGPFQHPEKLVPLAISRILRNRKVPLYGDGKHVRDWIFVEDHCAAIDLVAHRGTPGSTYLVSSEQELSNREVVEQILRIMGRDADAIETVPDRLGHDRRYGLDSTRLRSELGWAPRHSFPTALRVTVEWYRTHVNWWESLLTT